MSMVRVSNYVRYRTEFSDVVSQHDREDVKTALALLSPRHCHKVEECEPC